MSKQDKKIQAMRNNPKNIRFATIHDLLISKGFIESAPGGGSSHYTYHKGKYRITVPKSNPVNTIYIKQVLNIIDQLEAEK